MMAFPLARSSLAPPEPMPTMMRHRQSQPSASLKCLGLLLCSLWAAVAMAEPALWATEHRDGDDLVSAGLGLAGLRTERSRLSEGLALEPAVLRRLAFHAAWNGLSALHSPGGLGAFEASGLPQVTGREWHAFRQLPDHRQPTRVLLQLPDHFDPDQACLVASASSGSRGIYGAVPLVAPWALPRGCAVVYTDKGAGTDFFDYRDHSGVSLSGLRVPAGGATLGFLPAAGGDPGSSAIAIPHAHSGDHPERWWGEHVLDAIEWALERLSLELGRPLSAGNTRIIAAGLSNGANAVLRAAERAPDSPLIDGVVAVMPNISPPGTPQLFEYALAAALYQPCLLADLTLTAEWPMMNPMLAAAGHVRCQSLSAAGLLAAAEPGLAAQALEDIGFDRDALWLAAPIVALDLWRSVLVHYASAYLRRGPFDMPCGYAIEAPDATDTQRQQWWAVHPGVAPGEGMVLIDGLAEGQDRALPGLLCLAGLLHDTGPDGQQLRAAIEQTRASARPGPDRPVVMVHGQTDSLIPAALSSRPYVAQAQASHPRLHYLEIERAQHFDAFLAALDPRHGVQAILPHGWAALDKVWAMLEVLAQQSVDE